VERAAESAEAYAEEIQKFRRQRDERFRTSPFSQLALVHREYLKERTRLTLGSGAGADLRLPAKGIAPLAAVIEADDAPVLKALGAAEIEMLDGRRVRELALGDGTGWRLGRYHLRYIEHVSWGRTVEVYDPEQASVKEFRGMEYFPPDAAYRVTAEVVPHATPEEIALPDSHGNARPYIVYGELRFALGGTPLKLELYSDTRDPGEIERHGFMLIFSDATSGKDSYPAARYLDIEGKTAGPVVVDFNYAYSPPCNYSAVFTCPFPRPQNRLPVAVRAGQKWYRGKPAELLSTQK
jgi:hypothetical protein